MDSSIGGFKKHADDALQRIPELSQRLEIALRAGDSGMIEFLAPVMRAFASLRRVLEQLPPESKP